jgi:hypothetical protein
LPRLLDAALELFAYGGVCSRCSTAWPSPEQVRGDAVDTRTDFFSLGAVLYERLCGRLAFPAGPVVESGFSATSLCWTGWLQLGAEGLESSAPSSSNLWHDTFTFCPTLPRWAVTPAVTGSSPVLLASEVVGSRPAFQSAPTLPASHFGSGNKGGNKRLTLTALPGGAERLLSVRALAERLGVHPATGLRSLRARGAHPCAR